MGGNDCECIKESPPNPPCPTKYNPTPIELPVWVIDPCVSLQEKINIIVTKFGITGGTGGSNIPSGIINYNPQTNTYCIGSHNTPIHCLELSSELNYAHGATGNTGSFTINRVTEPGDAKTPVMTMTKDSNVEIYKNLTIGGTLFANDIEADNIDAAIVGADKIITNIFNVEKQYYRSIYPLDAAGPGTGNYIHNPATNPESVIYLKPTTLSNPTLTISTIGVTTNQHLTIINGNTGSVQIAGSSLIGAKSSNDVFYYSGNWVP